MRCPACHEDDNGVARIYSRDNYLTGSNRRLRSCEHCGFRFGTTEAWDPTEEERSDADAWARRHASPPMKAAA